MNELLDPNITDDQILTVAAGPGLLQWWNSTKMPRPQAVRLLSLLGDKLVLVSNYELLHSRYKFTYDRLMRFATFELELTEWTNETDDLFDDLVSKHPHDLSIQVLRVDTTPLSLKELDRRGFDMGVLLFDYTSMIDITVWRLYPDREEFRAQINELLDRRGHEVTGGFQWLLYVAAFAFNKRWIHVAVEHHFDEIGKTAYGAAVAEAIDFDPKPGLEEGMFFGVYHPRAAYLAAYYANEPEIMEKIFNNMLPELDRETIEVEFGPREPSETMAQTLRARFNKLSRYQKRVMEDLIPAHIPGVSSYIE